MSCECDLIRDLLPLYAERMASEATRHMVQQHLAHCGQCARELEEMKKELKLPADTDTRPLIDLGVGFRKKSLFTALCIVLTLLVVLHGLLILYTVPVWMSADEAITEVAGAEPLGISDPSAAHLVFYTAPNTAAMYQQGSMVWFNGYRLQGALGLQRQEDAPILRSVSLQGYDGESIFYRGYFSGEENTLLYGDAHKELALTPPEPDVDVDNTLSYLFYTSFWGGAAVLILGVVLSKKLGKGVAWIGLLLLCLAMASYFVTDGKFAIWQNSLIHWHDWSDLVFRVVHIAIFAGLLWCFLLCVWTRVRMAMKRRDRNEASV